MTIKKKMGFFAFSMPGLTSAYNGLASANWLFSDSTGSLVRFMRECSAGAIDISDAEVHHIVPTAIQASDMLNPGLGRTARLRSFADAARYAGHSNFLRFDAVVFGCFGGVCDTGSDLLYDKLPTAAGRWIPTAIFDENAPHNMICHEIGHVIGLDHSFWPSAATGFPFGEYGDPYDVMSTSGAVAGAHTRTAEPASGIAQTSFYWQGVGPGVAHATLWRYCPPFPSPQPWVHQLALGAPETTIVLRRAGEPFNGRPSLVALPSPSGGWWTVEFRAAEAWDQGFQWNQASPSTSPGLVIHRISDLGVGSGLPSYPRSLQVQYVATVPVPSQGDDDWVGSEFGVRFDDTVPHGVRIKVGAHIASARRVRLETADPLLGVPNRTVAGIEFIPFAGPDCAGGFFPVERVENTLTWGVVARTNGFSNPVYRWKINGEAVGTTAGGAVQEGATKTLGNVSVAIPVTRFQSAVQPRTVVMSWRKQGNRLQLDFPAGDGEYTVAVSVEAVEPGTSVSRSAESSLAVVTASIKLSPEAEASVIACIRRKVREYSEDHLTLDLFPKPVGPTDGPDWREVSGAQLVSALRHLQSLEIASPFAARRLREQVAADMGIHEAHLMKLMQEVGTELEALALRANSAAA